MHGEYVTEGMHDRSNSLLTNSQRQKLLDDGEGYSRQHRQRVRERTWNGTKDLSLLFEHMEKRDIEQVFEPDKEALSKTVELIEDIQADIEQLGRRASLEQRHTIQEISDILNEMQDLSEEQEDLKDDLETLHDRDSGISDVADDQIQAQRDELEVELRNVSAHREELVNDLQIHLEDIEESLHEQLELLEQGYERFDHIPREELAKDWQRQLDEIRERFTERRKRSQGLLDIVQEMREELEHDRVPEDDLFYLRDEIEQHARERRSRKRNVSREQQPPLRPLLRRLRQEIQAELEESEFDPELRDDFVRSLAFFFRMSEVLGTDTEDLIEEAYFTMFEQEYPDDVLDHVIVTSEAEDRGEAAERAAAKSADKHLSNAELRALAENDPETLVNRYSKGSEVTVAELAQRVRNDPEILERGLEIEDTDPKNPGSATVPDMIARDNKDQIVVMEFETSLTDRNGVSDRLQQLVQDYGGKDRVRGMLIAPESVKESEDIPDRFDNAIEIRAVPAELLAQ
jgi:L-rhamnose mutarotase